MFELINKLDINILHFIRNNFSNLFMDKLMVIITSLGDKGFIWIVIGLILLTVKKYRKVGFILLIALLITSLSLSTIKIINDITIIGKIKYLSFI